MCHLRPALLSNYVPGQLRQPRHVRWYMRGLLRIVPRGAVQCWLWWSQRWNLHKLWGLWHRRVPLGLHKAGSGHLCLLWSWHVCVQRRMCELCLGEIFSCSCQLRMHFLFRWCVFSDGSHSLYHLYGGNISAGRCNSVHKLCGRDVLSSSGCHGQHARAVCASAAGWRRHQGHRRGRPAAQAPVPAAAPWHVERVGGLQRCCAGGGPRRKGRRS
jgi:hypothetical protein